MARDKARDLSQVETRVGRTDRKLERRSGILPDRRNTEAPRREVFADMRSARRGDVGGADELRRSLGLIQRAGEQFQSYANERFEQQEEENASQASADAAQGRVDEEKLQRSRAYADAHGVGRIRREWYARLPEFDQELRGLIERQEHDDPEEREAEVRTFVNNFFTNFAVDPETGKLRADLPGAAHRWLGEEMQRTRGEVEQRALQAVEQRYNQQGILNFGEIITGQIRSNRELNIEEALEAVPQTADMAQVRTTFIQTVQNEATRLMELGTRDGDPDMILKGQRLLDQLAGLVTDAQAREAGVQLVDVPPSTAAEGTTAVPTASSGTAPRRAPAPRPDRVSFDQLAAAVMGQESGGRNVTNPTSGATGPMQTMPATLTDPGYGVRPARDNSVEELTRVGRDYLRAMLREYDGNYSLALAAYNAGPGVVNDWLAGTNRTGKNPNGIRLQDPRRGAEAEAAFREGIPFEETREYIPGVLRRLGIAGNSGEALAAVTPDDPVAADPDWTMNPAPTDVERQAADNPGQRMIPQLRGVLRLTPQEINSVLEFRDRYTQTARTETSRVQREQQDELAGTFLMGLYGQGAYPTSQQIAQAVRERRLTPQQGGQLFNLMRQNADALRSYEDRQEREAEEADREAQERQAEEAVGRLVRPLISGSRTPSQIANDALAYLAREDIPMDVRRAVVNTVIGQAGDVVRLREQRPEFRAASETLDEAEQLVLSQGLPAGRRASQAEAAIKAVADRHRARLLQVARDGGDVNAARDAAVTAIRQERAKWSRAPQEASGRTNVYEQPTR